MLTALNGRLPAALLVVADTGANGPQQLRPDAAASWARMLAAGMPHGCLRSGYRTLAQQASQDPALALPAGQSQHGEGLAADVDEPARSWVAAHGLPYGWRIGFVPGEPWHAQYDQPDQRLHDPAAPTAATAPPLAQEDDMMLIRASNGTVALIGPRGATFITPAQLQTWINLGYAYAPGCTAMDPGPFQALLDSVGMAGGEYAALSGQIAGLMAALKQVQGGGPIDLPAVTAAAEAGAKAALAGLTLTVVPAP